MNSHAIHFDPILKRKKENEYNFKKIQPFRMGSFYVY